MTDQYSAINEWQQKNNKQVSVRSVYTEEHFKFYVEVKEASPSQSPLLQKCSTERQRKTDAGGAAVHSWIAASVAGERPAGAAAVATSSPEVKLMRT